MYKVNILDVAMDDIVELIDYVRHRWSEDIAERAYDALMSKLNLLETQPHIGKIPDQLSVLGISTFRVLVHEAHTKILYELDDENEMIIIHMVFGSSQDFQTLLYKRIMRS